MNDEAPKEGQQGPEKTDATRATELSDQDLAVVAGGAKAKKVTTALQEACCTGTHMKEVVIELW